MTRPEPPPLTAERIERILERRFYAIGARSIVVPNVTALGHESDVLVLTARRYLLEIEIKVTIADFRADLRGAELSAKWQRQEVMRAAAARQPIPAGWRLARAWHTEGVVGPILDRGEAWTLTGQGIARLAPRCPNRFAYAYPVELHEQIAAEAPAWAGLIPITRDGYRATARAEGSLWTRPLERASKLLHRDKATDDVRDALLFSAYHRFWRERRSRLDAQEATRTLRERLDEAAA